MNTKKDIPDIVRQKAKGLIDLYGINLDFIGMYRGMDVYEFHFPENTETGYPFLYLYDKLSNTATEVTGFEALEIIEQLDKY